MIIRLSKKWEAAEELLFFDYDVTAGEAVKVLDLLEDDWDFVWLPIFDENDLHHFIDKALDRLVRDSAIPKHYTPERRTA